MYRNLPIIIKDHARKMKFERMFVDAQLICEKAGGSINKAAMEEMSLQHFFSICALNGINLKFEFSKK